MMSLAGDLAPQLMHLPNNCEVVSSSPSTQKQNKQNNIIIMSLSKSKRNTLLASFQGHLGVHSMWAVLLVWPYLGNRYSALSQTDLKKRFLLTTSRNSNSSCIFECLGEEMISIFEIWRQTKSTFSLLEGLMLWPASHQFPGILKLLF